MPHTRKHILNTKQRLVVVLALVLLIPAGLFPPWRYLNGEFIGFRPVWNPPPAIRMEQDPGDPQHEYTPIMIVPQNVYQGERKTRFSEEELRRPFIDVRRLLSVGAVVFLGAWASAFFLRTRNDPPPEPPGGEQQTPTG
ncbi:hypothetical protein GF324_04700 [bacterium]|nr:hypothetical protein [bacterium]